MRAIIINSETRTISETEYRRLARSLQRIVRGLIHPVYDGLDDHHHC